MKKMVSMKVGPEDSAKTYGEPSIAMPETAYPYGLKICLDESCMTKLGLTELPEIGETMTLMAKVEVVSASSYEMKGQAPRRSLDLQITDMALDEMEEEEEEDKAGMLYGDDE